MRRRARLGGALVLSRASLFHVLIAEIVLEEVTRELSRRVLKDETDVYLLKELDVLPDNIRHFNSSVANSKGITIVTPSQFLKRAGTIFPL